LSLGCLSGDPKTFDWASQVPDHSRAVLLAGASLAGRASQPACAEGALGAILDADLNASTFHNMAVLGLQGLALARGDYDRADSLLRVVRDEGLSFAQVYYAYDAVAGAPFAEQADAYADVVLQAMADGRTWVPGGFAWLAGLWEAGKGDLDALRDLAAISVDTPGPVQDVQSALRAHLLAIEGDTAAAIALLQALPPTVGRSATQERRVGILVDWWENRGFERLLLAEIQAARGDHAAAFRTASLLDHAAPLTYLPLLPRSLALRLRSAEAMNRPDLALKVRNRLEALGWTEEAAVRPTPH
jgi:hypothetical protein